MVWFSGRRSEQVSQQEDSVPGGSAYKTWSGSNDFGTGPADRPAAWPEHNRSIGSPALSKLLGIDELRQDQGDVQV